MQHFAADTADVAWCGVRQGKPVCSAVFRVFGGRMAEVPLVATRLGARRQGHARVLMSAFEDWFRALGVACLCLPAAQSTVDTWIHGFGFTMMTPEQLAATRSELRVLFFPGAGAYALGPITYISTRGQLPSTWSCLPLSAPCKRLRHRALLMLR